jgi:leucyl aminopeptidase
VREIDVSVTDSRALDVDLLAGAAAEPGSPLPGPLAELDERLGGRLARLAEDGELSGRFNTATVVHVDGEVGARRVAVGGLGPRERVDADALRTAAAAVARRMGDFGGTLGWLLDESLPIPLAEQARAVVDGTLLAAYDPGLYKSERRNKEIERLVVVSRDDGVTEAVDRARLVATWTNRARDLQNMPPNELTPERLAARAAEIAESTPHVTSESFGPDEIRELGMGAFYGVAQAAHNPAQLIVSRYDPPQPANDTVLGLVGKAITFDTGGISLKDPQFMEEMKFDMSGGAAVVEGTGAIAALGLPLRVVSVVAATENMPGGGAYRPGDILRARNGKTIEIISTDAEGRLVLADALTYAREQGATHILDLATLTGAIMVALGDLYAGVFANDDAWRDMIVEAGRASGDLVWAMPMNPRYRRLADSTFADIKNSASGVRQAGAIYGAEFLQEFAGDGPWAHLDIAGTAFFRLGRGDYLDQKGGTGYGVRLIAELASRLAA